MTTKIEKGAGAEAREPLTRPAEARSRAVTCAGPRINLDPFKGTGSRCCPWHAQALPLYRRLGSLVPNKPVWLSKPRRPLSGSRVLFAPTLSKNDKSGSARNCTWFAGLRNRCSSAKASGPSCGSYRCRRRVTLPVPRFKRPVLIF